MANRVEHIARIEDFTNTSRISAKGPLFHWINRLPLSFEKIVKREALASVNRLSIFSAESRINENI